MPEPATPYVLFLSRIHKKKGLDKLIPAMARIAAVNLVVAGNDEDNYTAELRALARVAGVEHRVHFIGPVFGAAKWSLLKQARLFVLPSYSENFGNVVLEAMAVGCPVVVTPQTGIAEIVLRTGSGIVCSNEPDVLAAEIQSLFYDAQRQARFGKAGRDAVINEFTWHAIAGQLDTTYNAICDSGRLRHAEPN